MFKAAARWLFKNKTFIDINGNPARILTDTRQLLGNKGIPPKELLDAIRDEEFKKYLELARRIVVFLTDTTPTDMYTFVANDCLKMSTLSRIDESGKKKYSFNNERLLYILALDHISLVNKDKGGMSDLKTIIDDTSTYARKLKNGFGISPVFLQQITPPPDNGGVKKLTLGHKELRDSKNTFHDTDYCFSLGSPFHDQIKNVNYLDGVYAIIPGEDNGWVGLQDRLRLISIEKDRYGNSGMRVACGYLGEIGTFPNMPPPKEVIYENWNKTKTFN